MPEATRITHSSNPRCRALLHPCVAWSLALSFIAVGAAARAETVIGNGKAASETRSTGEFNAVALLGDLALELHQGSTAAVVVHGDSNLLPLLESVVEPDRTLHLRWKRGISVRADSRAWVEVTAPEIRAVSSAGSGNITIDTMKAPQMSVSISGSGSVRAGSLTDGELSLSIAGSGGASLAGSATRLDINLSGSGGVDAAGLRADEVRVGIAGSGDAAVYAARTLAVNIAGSGNVTYSGEAAVQRAIVGSGQVRKR
jgi:hypothetical protein